MSVTFRAGGLWRSRGAARRCGSTISSVLIALSITSVLAVTTWVARPAFLQARSLPFEAITARSERHQLVIELIADLIRSSAEVAAIHPRGASPYAEIVLRLAGEGDVVETDQVALLSHSRLLQTLTLYTHGEATSLFALEDLFQRSFPDRWRGDPDVKPRLLAAGLSDMQVQVVQPTMLRIALTWSADSVDGEDEATVYVNARIPHAEE